jgi:hypothetical protein
MAQNSENPIFDMKFSQNFIALLRLAARLLESRDFQNVKTRSVEIAQAIPKT